MLNRTFLTLALSCALVQAADHKASITASDASLDSSIVGYFETRSGLVTIDGIHSAAHTRSTSNAAGQRVVLPPAQSYAWIERRGAVYTSPLPHGPLTSIQGAWANADFIGFNSTGTKAMLYRQGVGVQVVEGLPASSATVRELNGPGGIGTISAIAISDDAKMLLIGSQSGLYAWSADHWQLVAASAVSSVAFLPGRTDAIAATSEAIYAVKGSSVTPILQETAAPRAIVAASDHLAVVLSADGRQADLLDLSNGSAKHLTLGAVASSVERGPGGMMIFVPQEGRSPWLLDMNTQALSFAPELPENKEAR